MSYLKTFILSGTAVAAAWATLLLCSTLHAGPLMDEVPGRPAAAEFELSSITGDKVKLSDYRGKYILVNFWATWCTPCRKEMPAINNLHKALGEEGLEVIGVHVGPSLAGVRKFVQTTQVDFTILIDKDMKLTTWGVSGLPTTFLVDLKGRMVYKAIGEREWDSEEMVGFLRAIVSDRGYMAQQTSLKPFLAIVTQ